MIFLSVACDNLYMFKNFFVDFTYSRKLGHPLAKNDELFVNSQINVRKNVVILGGNASGKTTFGKLLCAIDNYLVGREIDDTQINLYNAIYEKDKECYFEVECVIEDFAYRIKCVFDKYGIKEESLKRIKIFKTYNIDKLRNKLDVVSPEIFYKMSSDKNLYDDSNNMQAFYSKMLKNTDLKSESILYELKQGVKFHYLFSKFAEQSSSYQMNVDVDMINKILPGIDNSVERVIALAPENKDIKTSTYMIVFKNKESIVVPDGDLMQTDRNRLSHGTYEAIQFLNIVKEIRDRNNVVVFVDENLAHLHVELEAYLMMKIFWLNRNSQIFFTTHNSELLDLNVPASTFALFKRIDDGNNIMLFVNEVENKNDRRLKNSYDNDMFGVLPDYSCLDVYFEDMLYGKDE